jgi:hypothetical protein
VPSRSRAQAEAAAARPTKRAGSVRRQRDGLLSALARDTERTARRVAERARCAGASRFGLRQRLRGARRQRERDHKGSQCFHYAVRRDQRGGTGSNFGIEAISLTQACADASSLRLTLVSAVLNCRSRNFSSRQTFRSFRSEPPLEK